jgi:uncharacterized protein
MIKVEQHSKSIGEALGAAIAWVIIKMIRFYQLAISPYLGSNCRHSPTCSNYMLEAITIWGPLKGTWFGLKRLIKCHPWGTSGYDPVPKKDSGKEEKVPE